jgi:hypothetical protein
MPASAWYRSLLIVTAFAAVASTVLHVLPVGTYHSFGIVSKPTSPADFVTLLVSFGSGLGRTDDVSCAPALTAAARQNAAAIMMFRFIEDLAATVDVMSVGGQRAT